MKRLSECLRSLWYGSASAAATSHSTATARAGQLGEDTAARYLRKEKGFRILARNWRNGKNEIDIIARDREILVFIEVRARQSHALVQGYHSVHRKKKQALRRCALAFLRQMRQPAEHYRFDIIEIGLQKEVVESLRHFDNVPLFENYD